MAGRGRGGVGGNTACATAGGIGDDGLSFVGSVQQCRFGGRAVGVDGAWLAPIVAGEYPHKTWLGTRVTKQAAGLVAVKNYKDWRTKAWPEADQWKVNSSPRYSNKCRKKIQDRLGALQPDGNEGTVTVESEQGEGVSGGAAADGEELELRNLCQDVVCSQLLKRVASRKRSLAAVKQKTARRGAQENEVEAEAESELNGDGGPRSTRLKSASENLALRCKRIWPFVIESRN